ncbi:hypothetical protein CHS0354_023788 [Potamilus streckersoni]|uniref:Acyl-CoA synthetase short-chain family member 3, mitochondrial n=1 Tax=Potamilus streckersoni TaxID=2493646 RepID=A0AAE0RZ34_9BIVA|nr:hypothetical protein CHS0354_023788 [Potamilus streckersoni]
MTYEEIYGRSIEHSDEFWLEQAKAISWFTRPKAKCTSNEYGSVNWFLDGELNMSYLALDYHVENGRAEQPALIYDSPVTKTKKVFTYKKLCEEVATFAGALKKLGVQKGDTVVIYMPLIPEGLIAMYACARLGAIHSVVFGGFAPHELQLRIEDAKPKVVITSTCGIEINRVIEYKPLVDKSIEKSSHKPSNVIVHVRSEMPTFQLVKGRDITWNEAISNVEAAEPVCVNSTHPLYILYTSGTTGKPKGVVRRTGDHAVMLKYTMTYIYNTDPGEVFWAGSDIGWVVGHSYIVYAPLIQGCTTVMYEGKPIKTPDAGGFWRVISEHKVSNFFTAPTAFRAIKKEDPEGLLLKKYDMTSLRTIFVAGERLDPPTYEWLAHLVNVPIVDNWWQTELGSPALANPMGIFPKKIKAGSAGVPVPGYLFEIKDDSGKTLQPDQKGNLTIKLPLPPGCFPTLWNDTERYKKSYMDAYPGYYLTGDEGFIDTEGYIYVMGRIDDVINVAGHRLSTGEMEEILATHDAIAECAVVGIKDELKGEVPVGFIVLKDFATISQIDIERELVSLIRNEVGALACFKQAIIVKRLPKTRSGKILRRTIRKLSEETFVEIPPTIDDPAIIDELRDAMQSNNRGVAQLVERCVRDAEVAGSNPVTPTLKEYSEMK